jgi:hypothetical protein
MIWDIYSHTAFVKCRDNLSQLLNVHGFNYVRQTEIQIAQPLVPEPSDFEIGMVNENIKNTNQKVLIRFQQNWLKQEVEHLVLGP